GPEQIFSELVLVAAPGRSDLFDAADSSAIRRFDTPPQEILEMDEAAPARHAPPHGRRATTRRLSHRSTRKNRESVSASTPISMSTPISRIVCGGMRIVVIRTGLAFAISARNQRARRG